MAVTIRVMDGIDRDIWAGMRAALWPEDSAAQHLAEIEEILASDDAWGFVAEGPEGGAAGFAEVSIRKYANGCTARPVAFLEGIWTDPDRRRTGIGAALLAHIEAFLTARGFRELCSDALAENAVSRAAHGQWGFAETEMVVYFRKPLNGDRRE